MRGRWSMFKTWVDAAAFLTISVAALCGYFHAPLWSAVMAAITLSVLTWGADRWTELVGKARELDAQWREIAVLARDRGLPLRAAWYYLRGWFAWLVAGVHMGHNLFFGFLSYAFGWLTRLFWGVP